MARHKPQAEVEAGAVPLDPAAPTPLAEAVAAFDAAEAELSAARAAVTAALDTWPGGIRDRRLLDDNRSAFPLDPDAHGLSEKQRVEVRKRVAYDEASAREGRAIGAVERARKAMDELQHAADVVALGDGRAALSAAVNVWQAAERLARANADGHHRAELAVTATYSEEAQAEATLAKAREEAPARIAAEFRGETLEPGQTVAEAEAALAAVRDKRETLRAVRDALEKEAAGAANRAGWKRDAVKAAAAHVVQASPELRALLDAHATAHSRAATIGAALEALWKANIIPNALRVVRPEVDRSVVFAWSEAANALLADPAAALPEIGP